MSRGKFLMITLIASTPERRDSSDFLSNSFFIILASSMELHGSMHFAPLSKASTIAGLDLKTSTNTIASADCLDFFESSIGSLACLGFMKAAWTFKFHPHCRLGSSRGQLLFVNWRGLGSLISLPITRGKSQ